ncbi:MAG: hypothetical protein COW47_02050 [Candidatus Huberarchaeum crystalense]|uniref:phenylalanine--tRNA ligase n=1 Tax=Huberarchaeum crystalense TaxID=2014257 RepID=A0A2G9LIS3_HUBC1|nr:phenylalanine--tRNA ligase subunit alpha [archaeon]PIN66448.1 MAG: hypothetical protein COW69_02190 [Candidatus Huberarchaeum crystalense]PIV46590.1 MAG: hypothetical protein COS22_00445 [Candidatus Huberarchaeum crystalense]PIV89591.1 MAG: hypothetical protein COW47_02050 [Candidatus Huberarchaeum crystalense]PIX28222.1 MAG: hypothetical protein COZ66_00525 [Candidatus Huberarchaeum crystalense]
MLSLTSQEKQVLDFLQNSVIGSYEIKDIANKTKMLNPTVSRAVLKLIKKELVEEIESKEIIIGEKGEQYKQKYLPEQQLYDKIIKIVEIIQQNNKTSIIGIPLKEVKEKINLTHVEFSVALGYLKQKGFIQVGSGMIVLLKKDKLLIPTQNYLYSIFPITRSEEIKKDSELFIYSVESTDDSQTILLQRGILVLAKIKKICLTKKGKEINISKIKSEIQFDVSAPVTLIYPGRRHPYNEVAKIVTKIFLEMGFQEMEGPMVETAFWCMDSMFIPQDHPARDVQDTYFVGKKGGLPDKKLVQEIQEVQENGGNTGSTGYQIPWSKDIASDLILRTHSTATTFRKFYFDKLKDVEKCKYFYIARIFRNEAIDATHLSEFAQVEGFVMADKLTLSHLKGFIKEFYAKLGVTKIKFKPVYNPYTEPSMQAYYYDEKLKKWDALINSGIFRPEALAPYGITKPVIAWGMGFNRLVMLLTKTKDMRDTLGPFCNLDWLRKRKLIEGELSDEN